MTKILDTTGRVVTGLGLVASALVWLMLLPFCAVWFVLISAFGPQTERQAREAS
jgi:hypothetical protein